MKNIKDFIEFLKLKKWRIMAQDGQTRILWKDGELPVILDLPDDKELTPELWRKLVQKFRIELD